MNHKKSTFQEKFLDESADVSNHQHLGTPSPLRSADVVYGWPLIKVLSYGLWESQNLKLQQMCELERKVTYCMFKIWQAHRKMGCTQVSAPVRHVDKNLSGKISERAYRFENIDLSGSFIRENGEGRRVLFFFLSTLSPISPALCEDGRLVCLLLYSIPDTK